MARNERSFQAEFNLSFKMLDKPFFYHKIRDDGGWQPFDAIALVEGTPIAVEYKMNYAVGTMNMKSMFKGKDKFHDRYHQIKNLLKYENAGGVSWFLFNWSVPLIAKKRKRINRTFFVSVKDVDYLYHHDTIPMTEFIEGYTTELERKKDKIGNYYWDLISLFDM